MAHEAKHYHHGNTPAAWTAVTIIMIAFLVGTLGAVIPSATVFWTGVALVLVGIVVGYVMSLMGYGQPRQEHHPVGSEG
ncbi:MAG: HGxxPAAW family protein [Actinomycetes bacterium]